MGSVKHLVGSVSPASATPLLLSASGWVQWVLRLLQRLLVSCGQNRQLKKWSLNARKRHLVMEGEASRALEQAALGVKNRMNRSCVPEGGAWVMSVCMAGEACICTCAQGMCMQACACMHGGDACVYAHMSICVHMQVHACRRVCEGKCGCMHACGWGDAHEFACMHVHAFSWFEPIWPLPSFPQPYLLPAEGLWAARWDPHATGITVERNTFVVMKPWEGACPCSQTLFPSTDREQHIPIVPRVCTRILQGCPSARSPGGTAAWSMSFFMYPNSTGSVMMPAEVWLKQDHCYDQLVCQAWYQVNFYNYNLNP